VSGGGFERNRRRHCFWGHDLSAQTAGSIDKGSLTLLLNAPGLPTTCEGKIAAIWLEVHLTNRVALTTA
jgi:hypothetical protein